MAVIWSSDLSTGVSDIDGQHKELFQLMNRFYEACNQKKGRDLIPYVFGFLDNYIKYHFATEEEYMNRYSYPGMNIHLRMHEDFKKEFAELKMKFGEPFDKLTKLKAMWVQIDTSGLLGQWWVNHINKMDKELGMFLKSKVKEL